MSRISFENYGERARRMQDLTLVSGRYAVQKAAERNMIPDVVRKLDLQPTNSLLDLGCNIGALLIPLSSLVREVVGLDHPSCIERLRARHPAANVRLIAGNFFDLTIEERFDKVLCYSVLHYLTNVEEVLAFATKAVSLLKPGGKALFGDLPNVDQKRRFLQSPTGIEFSKEWERLKSAGEAADQELERTLPPDPALVQFDDALVLALLRSFRDQGLNAFVLPQPADLPFGHTREDILVKRPA